MHAILCVFKALRIDFVKFAPKVGSVCGILDKK